MGRGKPLAIGRWPLAFNRQRSAISRRAVRIAAFLAVALLLFAGVALAMSSYEIPWFTVDSGGATASAGGEFTLGGTIGQADAGALSGGTYTLLGGFWAGSGPGNFGYLPVIMR